MKLVLKEEELKASKEDHQKAISKYLDMQKRVHSAEVLGNVHVLVHGLPMFTIVENIPWTMYTSTSILKVLRNPILWCIDSRNLHHLMPELYHLFYIMHPGTCNKSSPIQPALVLILCMADQDIV